MIDTHEVYSSQAVEFGMFILKMLLSMFVTSVFMSISIVYSLSSLIIFITETCRKSGCGEIIALPLCLHDIQCIAYIRSTTLTCNVQLKVTFVFNFVWTFSTKEFVWR